MKRAIVDAIRHAGHTAMAPLEIWHRRRASPENVPPPVFIIGAPRSGTSLLYELMITGFRFAYMSNAAHRFFRTPLAASHLFRHAIARWQGNFVSRYGHIEGWGAPNEGGWVWRRWLADGPWRDATGLSPTEREAMRRTIAGLASVFDAPFINKNVMHSNRLRLMDAIWPDALFIEVRRDVAENARSIIRAERANGGPQKHGDEWWSVRPRLAEQYAGRSDVERAVAQVVGVGRDIAEDMTSLGRDRLLSIDYAELCAAPDITLDVIGRFLDKRSCPVIKRLPVPSHFARRTPTPLSDHDERAIAQMVIKLV